MLISKKLIDMDIKAKDKNEIIDQLSALANADSRLTDLDSFRKAVYDREAEVSTSLGYSVAVPHGKTDAVKEPFVCFAKSVKGVKWNKQLVHLVFMIGVPLQAEGKDYLTILANIARNIMDENFRSNLLQTTDKDQVIKIINDGEQKG
ncbi:PTS sugar transporter subunit IIA [Lacticaseibacillus jixianensis]|uniref:PTS sugar transporter subunit IIA n=1 Tax=Lacticaseibacillus jixianensis TaxID=2486012 RepID=A0ABW4B9F8_9LACO|nr:fructose PTS transporter subunit IIA [Lacticaseibacillus jixianensis]